MPMAGGAADLSGAPYKLDKHCTRAHRGAMWRAREGFEPCVLIGARLRLADVDFGKALEICSW
jgi:hypothetical protein